MSEVERNQMRNGQHASIAGAAKVPTTSPPAAIVPMTDVGAGPARPASHLERAISEFEQSETAARREDPAIAVLMRNARILAEAKEHRLAVNILRGVLMRSPDHGDALAEMGSCLREDKRFDEAMKCFRALARGDRRQEAQVLIAETYYLMERDEMALAAYRDVLKGVVADGDQLFEVYKNIGNIHVRAGDFDAAEEFYDKAFTLRRDSDALMVNYGTLEIQRDSIAEAVQRFRRAVELNPANDKAWVGLALVHRQMGDRELAWANVQRALDINHLNRTAIRLTVEWGLGDGDLSVACAKLQDYLAVEGEDAEMSFTLAKIFTHLGRLREARLEMERVIALDPAIEGGEALVRVLDKEIAKNDRS